MHPGNEVAGNLRCVKVCASNFPSPHPLSSHKLIKGVLSCPGSRRVSVVDVTAHGRVQGPVVRSNAGCSANPGLKFNSGFFFFLSKALSRITFSIFFRVSNHQVVGKEFALTLGYLKPALNNPAQD